MTDNRTTELPCPFCGGEAGVYHYTSAIRGDSWRVVCGEPFCAYGPEGYNEAEAIAAWNARAERTCELEPLSAFDVMLNMLDSIDWGVCSECGCSVPMDAKFCNECGRAVER